jgi:hypothetical protein
MLPRANRSGLGALWALRHLKFYFLTLGQGAKPTTLDRRVMNEYVTLGGLDEAESLRLIEPLYFASRHGRISFLKVQTASREAVHALTGRGTA